MTKHHSTRILIVGAGPAGYTAAIYAARAGLDPLLITGLQAGGQLMITTDVENYPGFADVIQGPWLMEQMRAQAEHVGCSFVFDMIIDADFDARPMRLIGDSGDVYEAESVILATGAQARWLGCKGEETFRGYGVSACATCDGFFFKGKHVAVVGGGNTAAEEALYLTNHAESVCLIHRRDSLRADYILQKRLQEHPKIRFLWNRRVVEITGVSEQAAPSMRGIVLENIQDSTLENLDLDGLFIAIGHDPATGPFK
ncbi:MAG: FAD-dependent oxidoreductase, partial [Pseudomonadota bacterium]